MSRIALCLCLAVLFPTPTIAQDGSEGSASRTPESANRFLTAIYSQDDAGSTSYDVQTKDGAIVDDNVLGGEKRSVSGHLVSITEEGRCRSRLKLRDAQVTNSDGKWVLGDFERVIEWGKISKIEQTDVSSTFTQYDAATGKEIGKRTRQLVGLRITMRNNWQTLSVSTPSEEEMKRSEFAINFLREGCSVADDTGF